MSHASGCALLSMPTALGCLNMPVAYVMSLPGHAAGDGPVRLAVSWGSAVGSARASQIYTAVVTLP